MLRVPRDYQLDAIRAIREAFQAGKRGVAVELFTGAGKSVVISTIAQLARAKGKRCLVLVNRDTLCEQLRQSLAEQGLFPVLERGLDNASPMSDMVVGSVQTMAQEGRLEKWNPTHFQMVITDESHFSASATFKRVLDHFKSAYHLFMSATMQRHDGAGLWHGVKEIVYRKPIVTQEINGVKYIGGIEDGWLVPYDRIELPVPITIDDREAAKITEDDQGDFFSTHEYLPRLFRESGNRCYGKHGLLFWTNCDASREAAKHFHANGIDSRHIDGYMNDSELREIKAWFKTPGAKTCHCADYFSYGYDNPLIDTLGLMRICCSVPMTLQRIGRATRPNCIVDGLPDAEARKSAIAASVKPRFQILDLMLQLDDLEERFTDATCLITANPSEQKFIREEMRKAGRQLSIEEIDGKLKVKRETDAEKQLAKQAEDAANAAEKRREREENLRHVYVGDIVMRIDDNAKRATPQFTAYVRRFVHANGLECCFDDGLSARQVMQIKKRVEGRIKKLAKVK